MSSPVSPKFRAIIVGGGPVGLCLAHTLSLANIDYVLLEQRSTVVEESGFGLALWPHGVRILDQIGLLKEGNELYLPMKDKYNLRPDGSEIVHNNLYETIEANHGHPWMLMHRRKLLDLLYRTIPEEDQRILTKKKVISIDSSSHGVKVHCSDGTTEEGSIVIGCDGVHSHVRSLMNSLALKTLGKPLNSAKPMVAHYQLLAGHLRRNPKLEAGRLWEIRNDGLSLQIFQLEEEGWFLVYRRLPAPVYEYHKYTDKDAEDFAMDILDLPINDSMKFSDLWEDRKWVRMVNIEEGFIKKWHHDRIVLVGDAVHKMTPNAGLNVNQGWQGVVALTNLLRRLLLSNPDPDNAALEKVFEGYQKMTEGTAKQCLRMSMLYTRVTSWHNGVYKVLDAVGQWLGGDLLLFRILASPIVKQGIILDFVPEPGLKTGRIKWDN